MINILNLRGERDGCGKGGIGFGLFQSQSFCDGSEVSEDFRIVASGNGNDVIGRWLLGDVASV